MKTMKRKISIALVFVLVISLVNVFGMSGILKAAPEEPTNIALATNGTTVETDHKNDWAEGISTYQMVRLIDGKYGANHGFFMSSQSAGMENEPISVTLKFNENYQISKIKLAPAYSWDNYEGGFPDSFVIEAKTAEGWSKIVEKSGCTVSASGLIPYDFETVTCDAVRLTTSKNGKIGTKDYGLRLGEFEVYGVKAPDTPKTVNVALASKGTAAVISHPDNWAEENGYGVERVNDGNTGNLFLSEANAANENKKMTLTMTFSQTWKIDKAVLYAHQDGGFPVDFTLEAYTADGWKQVAAQTGYKAVTGANEFRFDAVEASALRLVSTKNGITNNSKYAIYLSEFEIYGTEASSVVPTPPADGDGGDDNPGGDDPTPVNVALKDNGGTPSTSRPDSWGEENGYGIANVNDGKTTGAYFITGMNPQYERTPMKVAIGFNGTYKVNQIKLFAVKDGAFPVDFTLEVYTASGWQTVVTKTGYQAATGWQTFDFEAVDCSAVRLYTTKNGKSANENKYGIFLGEFEAYGVPSAVTIPAAPAEKDDSGEDVDTFLNIALASNGTVAHVSHKDSWGEENGYGVSNLNDGKPTPKYYLAVGTDQNTKMKVALHFKTAYKINKINLFATQDGGFPEDFTLEAYTAKGWETIVTKKGYKATTGWQAFEFDAIDCSAVRLVSTKIGKSLTQEKYVIFLGEFEVYGVKSAASIPAAPVEKPVSDGASGTGSGAGGKAGFTYNAEKNIALNVPATASSDYAQYKCGVANVNDGNLGNFWSCNLSKASKGTPEWVEINLLDNYWIDTVALYARPYGWGFPIDFTISVFYDDEWIEVVKKTGYTCPIVGTTTEHVFTFPKVVGNKIRIEATNCILADEEYGLQIMEVAAYGEKAIGDYVLPNENIVSAATVVTSSSALEDYGYFGVFLTDGDTETGFSSKQYPAPDNTEWIELDFKRSLKMGELQLKPAWAGIGFPVDFTVEVFENGAWVTVLTVKDHKRPENEAWQKFAFDRQHDASKLRITATKLGEDFGQYSLKINEVRVFPYATEGENEGAVEVVNYERVAFDTAEKVTLKKHIPVAMIAIGGGMILLAVVLGVVYYVVLSKKMKACMKREENESRS